jgi:prevent-host-death family protein
MDINIAAAKPRLSELVDRAEKGEVIRIARRGKPVVELRVVADPTRTPAFDWAALKERLAQLPPEPPADPNDPGASFVEVWRKGQPY